MVRSTVPELDVECHADLARCGAGDGAARPVPQAQAGAEHQTVVARPDRRATAPTSWYHGAAAAAARVAHDLLGHAPRGRGRRRTDRLDAGVGWTLSSIQLATTNSAIASASRRVLAASANDDAGSARAIDLRVTRVVEPQLDALHERS